MEIYSVINMDIVGSRLISERDRLQNKLNEYIDIVYQKFQKYLPTPISITLGDEWQLITDSPSESYNIIHEFQQFLWLEGIELYAGIGIGNLSTSIDVDIRKMDGTSFHMAREALISAKEQNKKRSRYNGSKHNRIHLKIDKNIISGFQYLSSTHNLEVAAVAEDYNLKASSQTPLIVDIGVVINTIIDNNEILKSKMTQKQKEAYISYIKYGSYREVVKMQKEDLRESIAAISQKLNSAEYYTIQHNNQVVEQLLNQCCTLRRVTY